MAAPSLQSRILTLVALGIVFLVGTIGTASYVAVSASIEQLLHERLVMAQLSSDHLERALQLGLRRLGDDVAESFDPSDGLESERRALLHASVDSIFSDGVFLLDASGHLLLHVPPGTRALDPASIGQPLVDALAGRPAITNLMTLGSSGRRMVAGLEPLLGRDGKVIGVVGGGIDLTGNRLRELIETGSVEQARSTDLVVDIFDASGTVLASTVADELFQEMDHRNVVADHIRHRQSALVECHGCHDERGASLPALSPSHSPSSSPPVIQRDRRQPPRRPDIMALAPLRSIPWAVAIRQERSAVLAPALQLRNTLLLIASVFLLGCGAVVTVTVRSVVRPIRVLTERVGAIARGELDTPVPPVGGDEIGDLGRHVETMRERLRASLAEIRGWNAQLEEQVARRTAELSAAADKNATLYQELLRHEAARRRLLHKVIGAQEDERKRVARELHDSTSQELAALALRVDRCIEARPELAGSLAPLKTLARETLDGVHRLIFDLRPAMLDDLGLAAALRWLCGRQFAGTEVSARVELCGDERRLPPSLETTLFRLTQEALSNVARHAQASQVLVTLTYDARGVAIEVQDDGVGFVVAEVMPSGEDTRGLGLLGMRERVELWDGTIEIDAAPEQGCRVRVFVPTSEERSR